MCCGEEEEEEEEEVEKGLSLTRRHQLAKYDRTASRRDLGSWYMDHVL